MQEFQRAPIALSFTRKGDTGELGTGGNQECPLLGNRNSQVVLEKAVRFSRHSPCGGERSSCNGVSCSGTVIHPCIANIFSCFWEQTSAPYVSSKKREPERFYRAGNCKAEAKYNILKPKVKGGAERARGREGCSVFLYLLPDVRKGE